MYTSRTMVTSEYILLFDRDCGICSALSTWLGPAGFKHRIRLRTIQSSRDLLHGIPDDRIFDAFHIVTPGGQLATGGDAVPILLKRCRWAPGSAEFSEALEVSWLRSTRLTDSLRGSASNSSAACPLRGRRRILPGDERPQELQFLPVASVGSGKLEDRRDLPEAFVIHEEPNRLLAQFPFSNVLVAVAPRAEVALRVVQVKRADARQSHGLLHVPQEALVPLPRSEVVAGGKRMAGVNADSEPLRMRASLHDLRELSERVADDAALARGNFEDSEDVRRRRVIEGPVQTRGDRLESIGLPLPEVGPRMEDDVPDAKHLSPIQFLDERDATVAQSVLLWRGEVDQVVRMDDGAAQSELFQVLLERLSLLGRDGFRLSEHPRAPGENLDRLAADAPTAGRRECDALRDRDMGPELHASPLLGSPRMRMSFAEREPGNYSTV